MLTGINLADLCGWFGISRQAYYQREKQILLKDAQTTMLLKEIEVIREKHPKIGTRKIYCMLSSFKSEHKIKIGRDSLYEVMSSKGMLVRNRKRRIRTTNSYHRFKKYPNLIKDLSISFVNQLWVSDITYWNLGHKFLYISFITDAYSHKIVGFNVADTLETLASLQALKMAISKFKINNIDLIHHSDRGVQYCDCRYVKLLQKHNIKISMTEDGDPRENAIAERINGIIKNEYLKNYDVKNIEEAKKLLPIIVERYNSERPHNSISNLTPDQVYTTNIKTKKLWKTYCKTTKE